MSHPIQGRQAELESSLEVCNGSSRMMEIEGTSTRNDADISQMPFMSGVEVVRALREMGNPLYVVGCTGNALREDQVRLLYISAHITDI